MERKGEVTNEELVARYQDTGDETARAELIEGNLGLAQLAANHSGTHIEGLDFDDLVGLACIGLIQAPDRFKNDRGVKYSTYATASAKGEIRRGAREWLLLGEQLRERHDLIEETSCRLLITLGRMPTLTEIGQALGLTEEMVCCNLKTVGMWQTASLDQVVGEDPDSSECLGDLVPNRDLDPAEQVIRQEQSERLWQAIDGLDEKERTVVIMRFIDEMGIQEIADVLGLTRRTIYNRMQVALQKLRSELADLA